MVSPSSPVGFINGAMCAWNGDFTGSQAGAIANGLVANGKLWIGSAVANVNGTFVNVGSLTSPLGTVTIGYSSPNITLDIAGGAVAIEKIAVQTGTSPIVPSGGIITINGAVVAAGTNPVRTDGTGANTLAVEVQTSQALAAADATKIGLSNFDSASFAVAATGFVTLSTTGVLKTLTGNSGGAISPTANNINTLGTGSITISGSGSTLTTQLTGLTNHALQIGAGTATLTQLGAGTTGQVLQTNTTADPTWSTATYPSTTAVSQILYSSATNTVSGLATANSASLVTNSTGVPVFSSTMTNGQVIIGSTGATPTAATLSAGTGVSITNAAASITINAVGGGVTWSVISANQTAAVNNGYICNKAGTLTLALPAASAVGDVIFVTGINTATGWQITQAAGQQIFFGTSSTTAGATGTLTSSAIRDSIQMVCVVANLTWQIINSVGNITVV